MLNLYLQYKSYRKSISRIIKEGIFGVLLPYSYLEEKPQKSIFKTLATETKKMNVSKSCYVPIFFFHSFNEL